MADPEPTTRGIKLCRKFSEYESEAQDKSFVIPEKEFSRQFFSLYKIRLGLLRETVADRVRKKVNKKIPVVTKLVGIPKGKQCVVFGTLYKEMKLKPCILDEYKGEKELEQLRIERSSYVSESDSLILEDEYGRIPLKLLPSAKTSVASLASGLVVGVAGVQLHREFEVSQVFFAGIPPQPPPCLPKEDRYVALVSGLKFGQEKSDRHYLATQMLFDFLSGFSGSQAEQKFASSICRVIICGNSLVRPKRDKTKGSKKQKINQHGLVDSLKELDTLLTQLASSIHVDLMPGSSDPSNFSLPQQPLLSSLFSSARKYKTFDLRTNPCKITIDSINLLGTSGQNLDDLNKYAIAQDSLEFLEKCLQWRSIAPTAPDTLGCYPFEEKDPFLIDQAPHVFFAGNQTELQTRFLKGSDGQQVRLICVPSFAETNTIALLNLKDLTVSPVSFASQVDGNKNLKKE